jgi:hypothetical protein
VLEDSEATFQVNSGELLNELAEAAQGQKDPAECSVLLTIPGAILLDTTCQTKLRYQMAKPRAFVDPVVLQFGKHCAATPTNNSRSGKRQIQKICVQGTPEDSGKHTYP